jgi:hypothetical protein
MDERGLHCQARCTPVDQRVASLRYVSCDRRSGQEQQLLHLGVSLSGIPDILNGRNYTPRLIKYTLV